MQITQEQLSADGKQEDLVGVWIVLAGDPARAIGGEAAAGDDGVDV